MPYYPLGHFDLGQIKVDEPTPTGYSIDQADWSHAVISIASGLKLYVSRLTPVTVAESTLSAITLLDGGEAAPRYFATPTQTATAGNLESLSVTELDRSWLLVWFGTAAEFEGTNFPWPEQFNTPMPRLYVDVPILILFEHAPQRLQIAESGGLRAEFAGTVGRVAILPLFGDAHPLASDTEAWPSRLPSEVIQRADWWTEHLAQIPLSAKETSQYDETTDTVEITAAIQFLTLRSGGIPFAPLPPMLALAWQQGFPVSFDVAPVDSGLATAIGPVIGFDGAATYRYRLQGLSRYVTDVRVVGVSGNEPSHINQSLHDEIDKIVTAGHLAPWYPATNGFNLFWFNKGTLTWANPGENLYLLAQSLPLLDSTSRQALIDYLAGERTAYPPESLAVLPVAEGARRERWRLDPAELDETLAGLEEAVAAINHYVVNSLIPEENLYYLAEYARATDIYSQAVLWRNLREILFPYLQRMDWATMGWYPWLKGDVSAGPGGSRAAEFNGLGGVIDANHHFAALIGALRFSYWVADSEGQQRLWGYFARNAALRFALDHYARYLHDSQLIVLPTADGWYERFGSQMFVRVGTYTEPYARASEIAGQPDWMVRHLEGSWLGRLYTYDWTGPEDDVRSVITLTPFEIRFNDMLDPFYGKGLAPYRGLVPELGRFLADHQGTRTWAQTFVDRVEENMPDWYHALGRQALGQENNYLFPEASYQIFLARAWILQEPAEVLEGYLDVPWMARGDLYFVHKVAETAISYRGWSWQTLPVFTTHETPTPSFTVTPPPTPTFTPTPQPCRTSSTEWQNEAFALQTGHFTATFDAIPGAASIDGLTGLSAQPAATFQDLAVIVRFNTSGTIDARNGNTYTADVPLPYTAGETYHIRITVSVPDHRYSVYVTPPGGTEVQIADQYAFRTEQASTTSLRYWSLFADVGSHQVCHFAISN
ncbi:MAG: hypothetical protein Kow0047_09240 [Anaerolineae bacterium]